MRTADQQWALAFYRRSVIKQAKFKRITGMLGDTTGKTCLDIGGDNGVISYLLRQRGGTWHSADLDETTVASIQRIVGTNVHRFEGNETPFTDASFDLIAIVDFLEHIPADHRFAEELARILKPGGELIVNVPHLKPGSWINRLRNRIGLTDEKHGHVRPGYDLTGLRATLGDRFLLVESCTYSKAFSELVDTALNAVYEMRQRSKSGAGRSRKGTVVTRSATEKQKGELRVLGLLTPFLWAAVRLDHLLFLQKGYKLIARFRLRGR